MKWKIVTDSSCDWALESPACAVSSVPFVISAGDEDFVDDAALQVPAMLDAMERCETASHTSCPTPQAWLEEFEQADRCIAITISSRLSGSMNSAQIARELALERAPEKRIAVLDSRSTGPEIALCGKLCRIGLPRAWILKAWCAPRGAFCKKRTSRLRFRPSITSSKMAA